MKKGEALISLLLAIVLAIVWLGFLIHRDPRFAGSLAGGVLAITGSLILMLPGFYSAIKRVSSLKRFVTKKISFSTLLTIHIYAGLLGAILVILHTGHKFYGVLATSLTALLLIVVVSGYVGRYLLSRIAKGEAQKKLLLSHLESQFKRKVSDLNAHPKERELLRLFSDSFSRFFAARIWNRPDSKPAVARAYDIFQLSESIADVEYAVSTYVSFKKLFSAWLSLHIVLSLLFYFLLALHVAGAYFFGLRWFG